MENIDIVKAYFAAIDAKDMDRISQFLTDDYRMEDFTSQPLDKAAMLDLLRELWAALPNLRYSLSNIRQEGNLVKLSVQRSGTNSGTLDLRKLGIGVVPRTQKFIIFPNGNYEITVSGGKIQTERDVSLVSPNQRMSGMLKALGIHHAV